MCAWAGKKFGWCKVTARMLLAQQADLGVFWGLCEEVEALCGMCVRDRRMEEHCACIDVLKLCIFDLLLTSSRLLLLAKAPRHAQIRLLAPAAS